jgi:flagellar assembly factor FliW
VKLSTKYFGEIDFNEQAVLTFPKGLFAFEQEKKYLLLPFAGSGGTLLCLQSADTPELAFVVMNPFSLDNSYAPVLQPEELKFLEGEDSREFCYYVLCVVKNPICESTVNLKCPVAINDRTNKAMQVILDGDEYGMRHLLSEFNKSGDEGPC